MTQILNLAGTNGGLIQISSTWDEATGFDAWLLASDGWVHRHAPTQDVLLRITAEVTQPDTEVYTNLTADFRLRVVTSEASAVQMAYVPAWMHAGQTALIVGTGSGDTISIGNDSRAAPGGEMALARVFGGNFHDTLTAEAVSSWNNPVQVEFHGGNGGDYLVGSYWNDTLDGGSDTDMIEAGGGNDLLIGGRGIDELFGGGGADTFRFLGRGHFGDLIYDFTSGTDHFEIASVALGGAYAAGETVILSQDAAEGRAAQFIIDTAGLWFDRDGIGGRDRILIADLQGEMTLLASDILVI